MSTALGFAEDPLFIKSNDASLRTLVPSQVIFSKSNKNTRARDRDTTDFRLYRRNEASHTNFHWDIMATNTEPNSDDITFYDNSTDDLLPSNIHSVEENTNNQKTRKGNNRRTHNRVVMIREGNLPDLEW